MEHLQDGFMKTYPGISCLDLAPQEYRDRPRHPVVVRLVGVPHFPRHEKWASARRRRRLRRPTNFGIWIGALAADPAQISPPFEELPA